jgi:membrane-bound lytic murein transglycosylase D
MEKKLAFVRSHQCRRCYVLVFFVVSLGLSNFVFAQNSQLGELGADGGPEAIFTNRKSSESQSAVLKEDDPATDPSELDGVDSILPERYLKSSIPWRQPSYQEQANALGWTPDTFKVPENLQARVDFWKEIYSIYTSEKGLLHDVEDVTRVYTVVDFTQIARDESLSQSAKARARTKLLNSTRAEVQRQLLRLSKVNSSGDLQSAQDIKVMSYFSKLPPVDLFKRENAAALRAVKSQLLKASTKRRVRFQLGQRDKFILGVYYSGRYLREMERIFQEEGLPIELTRLPFVESSFNIRARSRVGASGIWQFMPRTAKTWMVVNRDIDERNDPLTATKAAARLMKSNYSRLGNWPLAMTAYNHGASGLVQAVRKTNTKDLGRIIEKFESRRFGFASSNFYACFLAALHIERNAREYLGDIKWSTEFDGEEVELRKAIPWSTILDIYDGEVALAELQNPHFNDTVRKHKRAIPAGTFVRVPSARANTVRLFIDGKMDEREMSRRIAGIPKQKEIPLDSSQAKLGFFGQAARSIFRFFFPFRNSEDSLDRKE